MKLQREVGLKRLGAAAVDVGHPHFLVYRGLFRDLERVSSRAKGRLLDIGCGNKPYEQMFSGKVSEHIGCDVVQSSGSRVDLICPANAIPIDDNTFDTVLCTQVIEHVADHQGLLREAFRVLRREGVLILSGPMYWPLHEEPYDYFRFTEHGLRHLLETIGFNVEEISSNGGKWALCGQVIIHTIDGTRIYSAPIVRALNRIFAHLDDRRTVRSNPMNYVVLASKA